MSTECVLELHPADINRRPPPNGIATTICRRACNELSYDDFFWNHMQANWPVVLTDVSNHWECHLHWTEHRAGDSTTAEKIDNDDRLNTAINYDYLRRKVGNCEVPVANCSKEYFNSHAKSNMRFYDYLDYWQRKHQLELNTIIGENSNIIEPPTSENTENLYLKDWHLKTQMPDYDFYKVPKYFASDWLNEYLIDTGKDDYRFVYMGPKDSWTSFHSDVFGSYSWSTNIVGCKHWILLPPGEESKLKDNLGNLPFRIDEQMLKDRNIRFFTIEQTENESIFVPSGWYHQVHNVTDTISVNHNWFNACNLKNIWTNLSCNMTQVIAEIEDCRQMDNFDDHCHTMLRASFGINFHDFLHLLEHIAQKRLRSCANNNNNDNSKGPDDVNRDLIFDTFTLNDFHVRHDLHKIHTVVKDMLENPAICDNHAALYQRCLGLEEMTKTF